MSEKISQDRSEQEQVRMGKLEDLRAVAYPYPNDVHCDSCAVEVIASIEAEESLPEEKRRTVTLAGRMMANRVMGKAAFCHIQDRSGKIQIYLKRDEVGEDSYKSFKSFDIGDIIEVSGYVFRTKTGEPSLRANSIRLLVKCLIPLPEKWHGLTDIERRYRERYLDLIVNPESRERFEKRSKIISLIRRFFDDRQYVEVETPVLGSVASGAAARPFLTHHNTLDMELQLRIALELPLKRLIVGGLERVYEIGRVFRNEGVSTQHNPEFTMIEFYEAYATYESLMDLTEELFCHLAEEVVGEAVIEFRGHEVQISRPWKRLTMVEAIQEFAPVSDGADLDTLDGVKEVGRGLGMDDIDGFDDYGRALFEIYDRCVEDKIVNPTFITRHPLSVSPLARPSLDDTRFTDRFELIIAGMELANAFSELNDPEDQRRRFESQLKAAASGDEEAMKMDEDFVRALEYGMPPTGGEGIGIDRLVMLLTGAESIRDVILFPTMRAQD